MARPLAALVASVIACTLASCGGDDAPERAAKDATAAQPAAVKLAHTAAGPNPKAASGVIAAQIEFSLKGARGFTEPFTTMVSGPFEYRKGAALPDYELELGARDYGVTLTSAGGKSYVTLGTTAYELPAQIRARLVRTSARGKNGLTRTLEQFGIAPARWETEQRIAGTETVGGVATTHIVTSFNAGRILKDANTLLALMRSIGIARVVGFPPTITAAQRRRFVQGVTTKQGASWIGKADTVLRQAGFTMRFAIPQADRRKLGNISGGSVVAKLVVSEVGEPQDIAKPAQVGSFADLELALDALGDAQEAR